MRRGPGRAPPPPPGPALTAGAALQHGPHPPHRPLQHLGVLQLRLKLPRGAAAVSAAPGPAGPRPAAPPPHLAVGQQQPQLPQALVDARPALLLHQRLPRLRGQQRRQPLPARPPARPPRPPPLTLRSLRGSAQPSPRGGRSVPGAMAQPLHCLARCAPRRCRPAPPILYAAICMSMSPLGAARAAPSVGRTGQWRPRALSAAGRAEWDGRRAPPAPRGSLRHRGPLRAPNPSSERRNAPVCGWGVRRTEGTVRPASCWWGKPSISTDLGMRESV